MGNKYVKGNFMCSPPEGGERGEGDSGGGGESGGMRRRSLKKKLVASTVLST